MIGNILTKTRTGFSSVPNEFLRDKKISIEAKGTASFLQSLPHGWIIHPDWVQKELGYGERVWLRVSRELIQYGCLRFFRGGKEKGSTYSFDFWNYEDNYLKIDNDKMSTSTKCGTRKMSSLTKKDLVQKKTNNKNNNKTPVDNSKKEACGAVVVILKNNKFPNKAIESLLSKHTPEKVLAHFNYAKSKHKTNLVGFTISSLENNWNIEGEKQSTHPVPNYEESKSIGVIGCARSDFSSPEYQFFLSETKGLRRRSG